MATANLKNMDVPALLSLRGKIDALLAGKRKDLESQLARLSGGSIVGNGKTARGPLKGRKVAPKYRGPGGETWAGRGARPVWLVALLKQGKKIEDYLIDKSGMKRKGRKGKRK
jgi:DNA-binding protein H-NS